MVIAEVEEGGYNKDGIVVHPWRAVDLAEKGVGIEIEAGGSFR